MIFRTVRITERAFLKECDPNAAEYLKCMGYEVFNSLVLKDRISLRV